VTLRIGSKNFTEQEVLGEIYAQGLAAAGYKVDTRLDLGDQDTLLRAVEKGRIDAYPEYTGTALLAFFGKRSDQIPRSDQAAYSEARAGFAAEHPPLVAYPPTPFTSSNEVAVTRATARRYKLRKISDLRKVADQLVLWGPPECRRRHDCLLGLEQVYGLQFKRFMPVPIGRRHAVLKSGRADVSIVFTTDPQIKRDGEVLLKDDRGMFPPYNSTLVVRKAVSDRAGPDLGRTVKILQEQLTAENMQELNARVDLDHKSPAEVAKEYLQETGLVAF
jgi:osmoprotectant transport system substrate-binding protein